MYYITTCKAEAFFRIHNNPIKSRAGLQEPLTHKSVVVMTQLYVPTHLLLGNLSRDMNLLYIDTATFDGQLGTSSINLIFPKCSVVNCTA